MTDLRPNLGASIQHLYVHIPFCHRICPYCSFYKHTPGSTDIGAFIDALLAELDYYRIRFSIEPRTLYFGGGTPSMLSSTHLAKLFSGLQDRFDLLSLEEWTLEANPRTFDLAKMRLCVAAGVSRVSLGVQSWNPKHLECLGRDHSPQEATEAFRILRDAEVPVVNIDHMFALPRQTLAEWEDDLEYTLKLAPDHISTYNLTYEEDTEFLKRFQNGEFHQEPDEDAEFFQLSHDRLVAAGFAHYETSNFAASGTRDFRSRHNRAYWQGADYLGLGPGAVSTVHGNRWTNIPDTARYIDCAQNFGIAAHECEKINAAAWLVERIALELRTSDGLRLALLDAERLPILKTLELQGLVTCDFDRVILTARGRLLADSVAAALI